jgi:hypothetical protein
MIIATFHTTLHTEDGDQEFDLEVEGRITPNRVEVLNLFEVNEDGHRVAVLSPDACLPEARAALLLAAEENDEECQSHPPEASD